MFDSRRAAAADARHERAAAGHGRAGARPGNAAAAALGLAVVAFAVTGCVHFQAKPLAPETTLDAFDARRLQDPDLGVFMRERGGVASWPVDEWDLRTLTLSAFFFSPDLDVARARWGVMQAGEITAGMHPNPSLSLLEGYNVDALSGVTPWIPEAVLDIPIETAGKRGFRVTLARQMSEAARLDVLSTAWRVRDRVRRALLDQFVAREAETLLTRQRDLQKDIVDLLLKQWEVGEVSPNEVAQARVALDRFDLAALDAERRGEQARIALADAIGVPAAALDGARFAFDALRTIEPDLPPAEARRLALVGRADILKALSEYEASQTDLQLEIARQYPDIHLGPGYQLDQTEGKWTLGIGLNLTFFNRNRGPIAEAEARRTEAAARFMQLQAAVVAEIDRALAASRSAVKSAGRAEDLLARLDKSETIAEAAYKAGEISRLDLLSVRQEVASGELSRLETLTVAQQAIGDLETAMQRPIDQSRADLTLEPPARTAPENPTHD